MAAKDPRLYLIHIRECCERILEYTAGLDNRWTEVSLVLDGVSRNLEIIGEAAAKLDPAFRQAHPEVPWRNIIDTRNILIHAYDQVKPVLLGGIVERDIPQLLAAVRRLLEEAASQTQYPRSMGIEPERPAEPDTSEELDLVTVFYSEDHDAQIKAQLIRGLLEASGVPTVMVDAGPLPNLPSEVRVPKSRLEEALLLIAESEAAGPRAAEEAERSSEEPA